MFIGQRILGRARPPEVSSESANVALAYPYPLLSAMLIIIRVAAIDTFFFSPKITHFLRKTPPHTLI